MPRHRYLDLAAQGHRVPIGTDLILHERPQAEDILFDGKALGAVVREAADRYATPLAIPLMDLRIEKEAMLTALDIAPAAIPTFHFEEPPPAFGDELKETPRMEATCTALREVARDDALVPIGMCIGPFSLMTKMVSDPITPIYLAGTGMTAEDDEDIETIEACWQQGLKVILAYLRKQIEAGAQAVIVCEPAANLVYFSPNQLNESYATWDRFVMDGLRQISALLAAHEVDFILHDCGELTDGMVERLGSLEPAMLSLGSSRVLWDDARLVSPQTVLYGNLPSKRFYATDLTTTEVAELAAKIVQQMKATGHPFILGSECDVLSVTGSEAEIKSKVEALMRTPV